MSSSFDWSQFETLPQEPSKPFWKRNETGFDWNQFQSEPTPDNRPGIEKGFEKAVNKTGRLATQAAIGSLQRAAAPIDIPAIGARQLGLANAPQEFRQNIFQDIETLQEKKLAEGWDDTDKQRYEYLTDLIKHPQKMNQHLPKENVPHFDVGSIIEQSAKRVGVDLTPKGADEMALRWMGFIKNPQNALNVVKNGFSPQNLKEVAKALTPSAKEILRGVGAAGALEYAANAELGPLGTLAALAIAESAPSLGLKAVTGAGKFAIAPIQTTKAAAKRIGELGQKGIAKGLAAVTSKDKKALQQAIINDFREAGIQPNVGTITGNRILQWYEGTLAQSGLTGGPLEELKKSLTNNIVKEYKALTNELGESLFQSKYEAGEALKTGLEEARELDKSIYRNLYQSANDRAADARVYAGNVASKIKEIESELAPGGYKSGEQSKVLNILNEIKKDVMTRSGEATDAEVRALTNNKIALRDAINYEVQGGATKLLEGVIKEIDKAILEHGKVDPIFARQYQAANEKFAQHAKLFRGKTLDQALKTQDPAAVLNKMNSPYGIEQVKKALSATPEGRELFKQLAAYRMEELIGQNMVDSTTNQLNFGRFSKLLEKGQNREIVKRLVGNENLKKLQRIQKASGRLADTTQKFLNTSRSGIQATDVSIIAQTLYSLGSALSGNPWPLLGTIGTYAGMRISAKMMADPKFLRLVEEAMLASKNPRSVTFKRIGEKLAQRIKELEEPAQGTVLFNENP